MTKYRVVVTEVLYTNRYHEYEIEAKSSVEAEHIANQQFIQGDKLDLIFTCDGEPKYGQHRTGIASVI